MSLITYAMQILMSVMMLTMVFVMTTIAREGAERICEVLDEKSDLTNCENPVETVPDGSVSFDHVNFYYSKTADKLCLDDVTVDIKSGETVGIIGGTGSSKSTFVQMIPPPQSGRRRRQRSPLRRAMKRLSCRYRNSPA